MPDKLTLSIARGTGKACTFWRNEMVTLDTLAKEMTSFQEGPKDGPGILLGRLENDGAKTKARIVERSAVVLDLDEGDYSPEQVADKIRSAGWNAIMHSTWSHGQPGKGRRYRVVLPLAKPILRKDFQSGTEFEDFFKGVCETVAQKLQVAVDDSVSQLQQMVYLPRHPANPPLKAIGGAWNEGAFLDANTLGVQVAPRPEQQTESPGEGVLSHPGTLYASLIHIDPDAVCPSAPEENYFLWVKILAAIHHDSGGSQEGFDLARAWSSRDGAAFNEEEFRKKWASFKADRGNGVGYKTVMHFAKAAGWDGTPAKDITGEYLTRLEKDRLFGKSTDPVDMNVVEFGEARPAIADSVTPIPQGSMYERAPVSGSSLGLRKLPPRKLIMGPGPGQLPRGVVGMIGGQGAVGKTGLVGQCGASVASGVDCTGGAFPFAAKGPVVMVLAEDAEDEIERRIWRIREEVGSLDLADLHIFYKKDGDPRLVIRDSSGNLRPTVGFAHLKEHVTRLRPALVVIDSMSVTVGDAETSNPDGAFVVSLLSQLSAAGDDATVLVLCHVTKASISGKGNQGKKATPESALEEALDPRSIRGASSIVNNARWALTMTVVPKALRQKLHAPDSAVLVAYAVRKSNYGPPLDIAYLINDGGFLRPFMAGGQRDAANAVLELLKQVSPVNKNLFTEEKKWREKLNITRDELREAVSCLIELGLVQERRGEGTQKLLDVPDNPAGTLRRDSAEPCENSSQGN